MNRNPSPSGWIGLNIKLDEKGLSFTQKNTNEHPGELARPRRMELASALNRLRELTM